MNLLTSSEKRRFAQLDLKGNNSDQGCTSKILVRHLFQRWKSQNALPNATQGKLVTTGGIDIAWYTYTCWVKKKRLDD